MIDSSGFFTGIGIFATRVSDRRDEAAAAGWGGNDAVLRLGGAMLTVDVAMSVNCFSSVGVKFTRIFDTSWKFDGDTGRGGMEFDEWTASGWKTRCVTALFVGGGGVVPELGGVSGIAGKFGENLVFLLDLMRRCLLLFGLLGTLLVDSLIL